jgi:Protein of unknown function (DUF1800)
MASVRQRRKQKSCAALRRKAKRIDNKRKRKAALKRLPKRCAPPRKPTKPRLPVTGGGTQPTVTPMPSASGVPSAGNPAPAPAGALAASPIAAYSGTFGPRQAERLLWRAGFGPLPGQATQLAALGLDAAVASLTRASGTPAMDGPEPSVGGAALDPYATWGHDHLWWLDRMVRSRHQLVERMALVWHDWFATSDDGVGSREFMLAQNDLFRTKGLEGFEDLVKAITQDKAMLVWLSGLDNRKGAINENYARELMELFTLGADRGAYTETDVRELGRSLSGWRADWDDAIGLYNFRFDTRRWDSGSKTVFGKTGAFTWEDASRLVVEHPMHPTFFVRKLWSYFIPAPPTDAQADALAALYVSSGHQVRPVLEAILRAPELYSGPRMVKPPVVFTAGLLRATGQAISDDNWVWMCATAGQQLLHPPDVSGWDDTRWLDTSTMAGRWTIVNEALRGRTGTPNGGYPAETADQALLAARTLWNDPPLTDETLSALRDWGATAVPANPNGWMRAYRANALKMLVGMCPDHHTS